MPRRENRIHPGLVMEQDGSFFTFTYGGVFEAYALTADAPPRLVDCSDRGVWPTAITNYVRDWCHRKCQELAKEKAAGETAA
jgi:hypothetical protein